MADRTIKQQLRGLTGLSVTILVVLAVVGIGAIARQGAIFSEYQMTAKETVAANAVAKNLNAVRTAAFKFRISPNEETIVEAEQALTLMLDDVRASQEIFAGDDEFVLLLEGVAADVGQYGRTFEGLVALNQQIDALVLNMTEAGTLAEESVVLALETSAAFGEARTTATLSRLQHDMYRASIYIERYLQTESEEAFENARKAVSLAKEDIASFDPEQLPGPSRDTLSKADEHLTTYWAIAEEIHTAILQSQENRTRLDTIGPRLAGEMTNVVLAQAELQTVLGERSTATSRMTFGLILAVGIGAIFASLVASRRISTGITSKIQLAADEMSQVADGDLNVDISNADAQTEIGEMARALEVFRNKAIEARDLQAAREEEVKRQAQLEAERAEQEQLAERKRQEEAARERQEMIGTLQKALGSVVDAAAEGDFSRRVDAQFDDAAFRAMAASLNRLLDNVEDGLNQTLRIMTTLSEGDLTDRFDGTYSGVFEALQTNVNGTIETLSDIVLEISAKCDTVGEQAGLMSDQATSLSERAEKQAASLEETSAAMDEMAASAASSAQGASEAAGVATEASNKVEEAGEVVVAAVDAMSDIKDASDRIGEIVSVIEGIAFQTNLLALNASVEAARAGSAGKGFAVVASEVRALAQRSSEASQDIKALIEESAGQVDRGVDMVENTGKTLKEIVTSVKTMAEAMDKLTTAAREQSAGVHEVTSAISQLDVITQKNASLAETSRESSTTLKNEAEGMRAIVGRFRTGGSGSTTRAVA